MSNKRKVPLNLLNKEKKISLTDFIGVIPKRLLQEDFETERAARQLDSDDYKASRYFQGDDQAPVIYPTLFGSLL